MVRADSSQRRDALASPHRSGNRRWPSFTVVLFAIAFLGSAAFIAWGFVGRTGASVEILVVGLLVMALTLGAIALGGAIIAYRSARSGDGGRAFLSALGGGAAAVGAWLCLGAAAVLAMLYRTA
jgi:hypothetical protein